MNFAGSVDWAVDLQRFGEEDKGAAPDLPMPGSSGCVAGEDLSVNTADLCYFSCGYGFCPETWCACLDTGEVPPLPAENTQINVTNIIAWDEEDVDLHRLCRFACKYGYCPGEVCTTPYKWVDPDAGVVTSDQGGVDMYDTRNENAKFCYVFDDNRTWQPAALAQCKRYCQAQIDEAAAEDRTTSYGCATFWKKGDPDPWISVAGIPGKMCKGECSCDNMLINTIAETFLEAMPILAQVIMSFPCHRELKTKVLTILIPPT